MGSGDITIAHNQIRRITVFREYPDLEHQQEKLWLLSQLFITAGSDTQNFKPRRYTAAQGA
jgi:hypothetical protein